MVRAVRSRLAALALVAAASACDGYAALDLPVREGTGLEVEHADLHAGANGLVQVRVDLPDGVTGPLVVVSPPQAGGALAAVTGYAHGPCPGAPEPAAGEGVLRLCVSVFVEAGPDPGGLALGLVVESRHDDRRFSAIGSVFEAAP